MNMIKMTLCWACAVAAITLAAAQLMGVPRGGRAAAILYSLVASAKRNGLDPFAYLRDLLARIPTHPQRDIAQLFPDHWKTAAAQS